LLCHLAPPVVFLDRTLLRHTFTPCGSAYEGRPSLPEREVERGEQRACFVVGARAGANGNVEAPGIGDLVEIDLRKDRVFLDAKAVVATAVEALWIEPAEIAHAWQRDIHEAVQEIIHACLAQRDFAADGLAIAQLVGRNRLARLGDHGFLTRDQRQVAGGVIHLLAVGDTLTDAHVEHDLRDRGHLHAVCVAEFLRQLAANDLLVVGLHARDIVGTLARLLHLRLATFRSAAGYQPSISTPERLAMRTFLRAPPSPTNLKPTRVGLPSLGSAIARLDRWTDPSLEMIPPSCCAVWR